MATTPTKTGQSTWDDALESLYESWHRRVAAAEHGHRLMADRLRRRYFMLGIPVVVLTTLVGTSAFASLQDSSDTSSALGLDPDTVLLIVGSISVLAAVLSSLQTFLRYATRAEGHRIAALRYETLRRDMAETLALPRASRSSPERVLDGARTRMDKYAKESPTIGERSWMHLSKRFHLATVPPDPVWHGDRPTMST